MPAANRLVILVPVLNEARVITSVMDNLVSILPPGRDYALYVVDGGSSDDTPDLVRQAGMTNPNIHLLHNPRRLQSAAINLAARQLMPEGGLFFRCDAHTVYPDNFFTGILSAFDASDAHSVVVPMDSVGEGCVQKAIAWVSDTPAGSGGSGHRGGRSSGFVDHGHHAAMRAEAFHTAGGYDESYSHNEDAELDCRIRATGGAIWLESGVRLIYKPRATFSALAKQYFNYGRGRSRTVRRHPGSLRARQLAVPLNFGLCVAALIAAPFFPLILAYPALYLLALTAIAVQLTMKKKSACALLAAPAAFLMHNAWAAGFLLGLATIREKPWHPQDVAA